MEAAAGETPLRRAISSRMLLVFVVGDILGAGIYALVGEVGAEVGGAIWRASSAWRPGRWWRRRPAVVAG